VKNPQTSPVVVPTGLTDLPPFLVPAFRRRRKAATAKKVQPARLSLQLHAAFPSNASTEASIATGAGDKMV